MKKRFKVKEKFLVTGWTYVMAENEEEAVKKIEEGEGDFSNETDFDHRDTLWETLKEDT